MASRDELYAKFGITAEAAQLFETDLGSLLFGVRALQNGWCVTPSGDEARALIAEIDLSTLGKLLTTLKRYATFEVGLDDRFRSALKARNQLFHGFYERHNFKINSDTGRDEMIADLEALHEELFSAWRLASAASEIILKIMVEELGQSCRAKPYKP